MSEEKRNIINKVAEHYTPLGDACIEEYIKSTKILRYDKPTVIIKEGEYSDKTYFIASGAAGAYYLKDGKDISDWFAFENDFISSVNSFILDVPSPHYVEVLEPSVLLEISRDEVNRLTALFPEVGMLGYQIVVKVMLQLQHRIVSLQFETAQQKYDNLLKIRPDITQRVPLTHIASFIGITLETLSRIRNPKNRI